MDENFQSEVNLSSMKVEINFYFHVIGKLCVKLKKSSPKINDLAFLDICHFNDNDANHIWLANIINLTQQLL